MLQVIHKYKTTLVGFIFLGFLALSVAGLGLDALRMAGRAHEDAAITVNEDQIGYSEVAKMRKNATKASAQQIVDHLIDASIVKQQAQKLNLHIGDDSVRMLLAEQLPPGLNKNAASELLRQIGMSGAELEDYIRKDALNRQFTDILRDIAAGSERESRTLVEQQETAYNAAYVEFKNEDFFSKTSEPTTEAIENYYNDHTTDYTVESGVKYDYVLFDPDHYAKSVEVSQDDIEMYYADNQSDYSTPEEIKVKHIRMMYAKNAKPEAMADLKERAQQVLSRAKAGESFDSLALEFSDDTVTKTHGGDLGWVKRGKMSKEFDSAAFKMKEGGVADLVSTDYGFHIVKVDEYKPSGTKELSEVKDRIIKEIQKREAPAYAATRGQELFEEWRKGSTTLTEFAAKHGLTAASTKGILEKETDPEEKAKGLTSAVLLNASDKKQLADISDKVALVEVTAFRESDIAPLSQVKDQVRAALKKIEAKKLASEAANKFIHDISDKTDLVSQAKADKYQANEAKEMYRMRGTTGPFADPDINDALFSTYKPMSKPERAYNFGGNLIVFQVTEIKKPDASKIDEKLPMFRRMQTAKIAAVLVQSIINKEKKDSIIDIKPGVLTEG